MVVVFVVVVLVVVVVVVVVVSAALANLKVSPQVAVSCVEAAVWAFLIYL